jgi:hypothetical protein
MVEAAIVVGDLLRPDGRGRPRRTDPRTLWLWNAIKRQISLASDLPPEALTAASLTGWIEALQAQGEADLYRASVHDRLPTPERIVERLHRRFWIGYEMPPWLVRLLDQNTVPCVDLRLHPVRFLDDLLFAARPSWHAAEVEAEQVANRAGQLLKLPGNRHRPHSPLSLTDSSPSAV